MPSSNTRRLTSAIALSVLLISGCEKDTRIFSPKMGAAPGAARKEYRGEVKARPILQDQVDYSLLVLPPIKGRAVEIVCGSTFSPWFSNLPRDRELVFTVWQTKRVAWHTDDGEESFSWDSEIETIKDGPTLLYDAAICPIHKVRMDRGEIQLSHGLPSKEFMDAYDGFSGGPGFEMAGCVIVAGEPTTKFGYTCVECVAAYRRWSADQNARRLESARVPPSRSTPE